MTDESDELVTLFQCLRPDSRRVLLTIARNLVQVPDEAAVRAMVDRLEHEPRVEDRCCVCGALIGIGVPALHVGICDACRTAQG